MSGQTRKKIQKKFKIRGYGLKIEALDEILSFVNQFPDAEDEAIDLLLDQLQQESLKSVIIDKEPIHRVISLLLEAEGTVEETPDAASSHSAIRVIDSFLVPKFRYDPVKKQFNEHTSSLSVHGEATAKLALYRNRFLLLFQRLSRDVHFSRPTFDTELSHFGSCESLVVQRGRRWVMGVISQLEDGHFYLEDLTASVEIDLSKAKITTGFFTENTIVVAEGEMQLDGIFQGKVLLPQSLFLIPMVITCGFPPLEDRDKSLKFHAGHDFFGGDTLTKEETLRLADLERRAVNDMFFIISDVWLDNDETMGKLETLLSGFDSVDVVPSLFVFMENFCSHPCNLSFNSYSSLRLQFGKLKMIGSHQQLKEHSQFLFIPGPDNAGPSTVLPRCALPEYLTEELADVIPNSIFSSNPCRIKFYTQEIVFFRQDLLYRMRRSCLITPSTEETEDPFEHIVLGDKSEQKAFKYTGITCFNPGSFSTNSTFVAYRPSTQEVEFSAL